MNFCSTPKQVDYLKEGFLCDYFAWRCANDLIHENHPSFKEQCQKIMVVESCLFGRHLLKMNTMIL